MSEEQLGKAVCWAFVVGLAGNLLLCLNLYRQIGNLEYKVHQLDSDLNVSIQSLSRDVWDLKHSKQSRNRTGEFE